MALRNHSLPLVRGVAIPLRWNTVNTEDGGRGTGTNFRGPAVR